MESNRFAMMPADVVFVRTPKPFSRMIRFFSTSPGEPPTETSHVALAVDKYRIIEAVSRVRLHALMYAYSGSGAEICIYRHRELTDQQRAAVVSEGLIYKNRPYGWLKIIAHALDWLLGGRYVFRRFCWIDYYPICSYLDAKAYDRGVLYRFGKDPKAIQPDDVWDWVTTHKEWVRALDWTRI